MMIGGLYGAFFFSCSSPCPMVSDARMPSATEPCEQKTLQGIGMASIFI